MSYKRSDVTTLMLCRAIVDHGFGALDLLAERFPRKVLIAAVHRDTSRGYITYGVSVWRPFLDHLGRELLMEREFHGN